MRKPQGYATIVDPGGPTKEADTFTCRHCQHIVTVRPLMDAAEMGGLCKVCMSLICKVCVGQGTCTPWERQMEEMEARERFRRSAGL